MIFFTVAFKSLYCFQYQSRSDDLPKTAGWDFFKLENEFKRMKVPNDQWTLTTLNQKYQLCDTYPSQIYVPASASTAMLMGSSRFRSKGRLPALTYLHPNKVRYQYYYHDFLNFNILFFRHQFVVARNHCQGSVHDV